MLTADWLVEWINEYHCPLNFNGCLWSTSPAGLDPAIIFGPSNLPHFLKFACCFLPQDLCTWHFLCLEHFPFLSLCLSLTQLTLICLLCAQVKSESFAMGSSSSPPESSCLWCPSLLHLQHSAWVSSPPGGLPWLIFPSSVSYMLPQDQSFPHTGISDHSCVYLPCQRRADLVQSRTHEVSVGGGRNRLLSSPGPVTTWPS